MFKNICSLRINVSNRSLLIDKFSRSSSIINKKLKSNLISTSSIRLFLTNSNEKNDNDNMNSKNNKDNDDMKKSDSNENGAMISRAIEHFNTTAAEHANTSLWTYLLLRTATWYIHTSSLSLIAVVVILITDYSKFLLSVFTITVITNTDYYCGQPLLLATITKL